MKNLSGSPRGSGKSAVRQVKGPGMNEGMKKPRKNGFPKPKPYKPSKAMKSANSMGGSSAASSSSYLPAFRDGGSVQAMASGKGKRSTCK